MSYTVYFVLMDPLFPVEYVIYVKEIRHAEIRWKPVFDFVTLEKYMKETLHYKRIWNWKELPERNNEHWKICIHLIIHACFSINTWHCLRISATFDRIRERILLLLVSCSVEFNTFNGHRRLKHTYHFYYFFFRCGERENLEDKIPKANRIT